MGKSDKDPETPAAPEWKPVAIFVCVCCGKEKRSQKHLNLKCEGCVKDAEAKAVAAAEEAKKQPAADKPDAK